jgi:hypothetical protein
VRRRDLLIGAGAAGLAAAVAAPLLLARRDGPVRPGFRLLLAGDTHHGENYVRTGRRVTAKYGYDHSFEKLRPLLGRADYVVVNMETPATDLERSPLRGKNYLHRTSPAEAPPALVRAGIRAVGLANNHSMDYGPQGLLDTFAALHRHRIRIFGAGPNLAEAEVPLVLRIPTTAGPPRHVAVFAMFEYRPDFDLAHRFYASPTRPGVARLDPGRFARQVERYRSQYPNLFVVAFAHWGKNYAWRTAAQAEMGRALVDAGADLVLGHHGHNFQEIERYRGTWILYGIGNFMFNSLGRFREFGGLPPYALGVELDFPTAGTGEALARAYPILVDNIRTRYQPRIPDPRDGEAALRALLARSQISPNRLGLSLAADTLGPHLRLAL